MHLILDSYSNPGISMFWKRHGLGIMEQLVPTEFFLQTVIHHWKNLLKEKYGQDGKK